MKKIFWLVIIVCALNWYYNNSNSNSNDSIITSQSEHQYTDYFKDISVKILGNVEDVLNNIDETDINNVRVKIVDCIASLKESIN